MFSIESFCRRNLDGVLLCIGQLKELTLRLNLR